MNPDQISQCIVKALDDIKAKNIEVLHVTELTTLCDIMIIASGDSTRQTKALARNIEKECLLNEIPVHSVEGGGTGEWILVDCGSVIVHIMQPTVREYYNLSELWGGAVPTPLALSKKKKTTS
ncbi:MAG: ribosome silencing factor [Ferrovum sp. 37-45-19]|jgi:ribosome-associated protein|uniref:ribosome silencing factor n=1 Tax=Ferrovum sp. JA12 TaxID=1356299 RepID=UPI000702E6AA|nr:ribosome silencing factor [Ferrovum sp. JA12]OYV80502.1 MAG: ribosome silencing factor [Ferrovum sp. 21-44-67]OYV94817.1 MAG: ribosome silencing factor [Ferrovum sp. 37-45-19]OZB34150.1 MAG: ribosome silencing factor [Ferrovum sp. 34-44-207]HQT81056.1 ribosome silencing factor [Ferrovaceae bacterium]KRH79219.1 ribosomal silencing factor RsfS [Ferrovum sp. JA12]